MPGLYGTARWQRRRLNQLRREPLCRYCLDEGKVEAAIVADHIIPHKGDAQAFWHGSLQSLCVAHHSGTKQATEKGRPRDQIGMDGYAVSVEKK